MRAKTAFGTSVTQLAQPISPTAESVTGAVADTATIPEAFGRVITRGAVGLATANVVLLASTVRPSKISGDAPTIFAPEKLTLPVEVRPVRPEAMPAEETSQVSESTETGAVLLPKTIAAFCTVRPLWPVIRPEKVGLLTTARLTEPAPLVTVMFVPAVSVARE